MGNYVIKANWTLECVAKNNLFSIFAPRELKLDSNYLQREIVQRAQFVCWAVCRMTSS